MLEGDDCGGCVHLDDDGCDEKNVEPTCLITDTNLSDMDRCPLEKGVL